MDRDMIYRAIGDMLGLVIVGIPVLIGFELLIWLYCTMV